MTDTIRNDDICDVPGLRVGHDTLTDGGTGCTVLLCEWPALGAIDVRGGAPATRETDLLDPLCFMREVHAVLLTGGSAFGLDAASGVMRVLEERGIGFDAGPARVPIVPAAALFDLGLGPSNIRPDAAAGARAVTSAAPGPVAQGSVGAGTGATVGKAAGPAFATKGGIGSASALLPSGHRVGALVAVNAVGDIYDPDTARIVAGARAPDGKGWLAQPSSTASTYSSQALSSHTLGTNTTLAIIATDAPWGKAELGKLAQMAHDGLARAIRPIHTPMDGDIVFALSTAHATHDAPAQPAPNTAAWPIQLALTGEIAAQTLARAVVKAVRAATGLHGIPALRDLKPPLP